MNLEKLYEIFSHDPEIECHLDIENINPTLVLRVRNSNKANAIERLIHCPAYADTGVPRVVVVDTENSLFEPLFITAFKGNILCNDFDKLLKDFTEALI